MSREFQARTARNGATTIRLGVELRAALAEESRTTGTEVATIIRQALDAYLIDRLEMRREGTVARVWDALVRGGWTPPKIGG